MYKLVPEHVNHICVFTCRSIALTNVAWRRFVVPIIAMETNKLCNGLIHLEWTQVSSAAMLVLCKFAPTDRMPGLISSHLISCTGTFGIKT